MSIYQLRTFGDIIDAVCEELKIQSGDLTSRNRIRRDINMIYLNEVAAYEQWSWLRDFVNLTLNARLNSGTATVTQNSRTVTLTIAPANSMVGAWFSIEGSNERYTVLKHTAGATTLYLDSIYTGATLSGQTYQLWRDKLPLPADCRETFEVTHDYHPEPLEGVGLQKFKQYSNPLPKAEGYPRFYTTSDYNDPIQYAVPSAFPASVSRSSSGLTKTITFASDVSSFLEDGDEIEISGCSMDAYNGQVKVVSVDDETITYTSKDYLTETTTSDTSIVLEKMQTPNASRRYRELLVYPSVNQNKLTLHVDYIKILDPLENDSDEPLMPLEDRIVLFYGAASRAWSRVRNAEEAQRNGNMYERKLSKMAGKLDDSTDQPTLRPSRTYLSVKRRGQRYKSSGYETPGISGGSSGPAPTPTGTANTVAIYDANGDLGASPTITTTELNQLNGIQSAAVGISDTQTLTNKTINAANNTISNISDANISASAAISYSKLNLTGSIVNADISASAAIAYSKLNLAGSIVNADVASGAAIVYSKLSLSNSIVNADINSSAAISYSKLNLSGSIVNADVNASAAIAYSKLNLASSIVNADINASAAIAYSKLNLATSIVNADISASAAIAYSKLNLTGAIVAGDLASGFILPANQGGTGIANGSASTITISGAFGTTFTVTNTTTVTLPTTGTLSTLAGSETLSNKTLTTPTINQPVINGFTDASTAGSGVVGQVLSNANSSGSSLTTATGLAIANISVPAGDWDIWGFCAFSQSTALTSTQWLSAISTTQNSGLGNSYDGSRAEGPTAPTANADLIQFVRLGQISINSTTMYYLNARASFSAGSCVARGSIFARRVR